MTETAAVPIAVQRRLPPEEAARADFYALLARLIHAAPDAALLGQLAAAPALPAEGDKALAIAWRELAEASAHANEQSVRDEHEALFVAVGKAAVSTYAGTYAGAAAVDHPRIRIQRDLAALGLEQPAHITEPEDHIAGLLEVMRVLVAGGAGRTAAPVASQRRFFEDHLEAALGKFFAAVAAAPESDYYRRVAAFGAAFSELEIESFQLD